MSARGRQVWLVAVVITIALLGGCFRARTLDKRENAIVVDGLFSLWASWVQPTRDGLDVRIHIVNGAPHPIIIDVADLYCSKGDRWGKLVLDGIPARAASIHLLPRQRATMLGSCRFRRPPPGEFRLLVAHIYESRTWHRQPRTPPDRGEVVATDVEWVLPARAVR